MTTKSLKKFTELLNRREGISLTPIIVMMVIMSVMGGVFTSIMGVWKVSAPVTVNSSKAFYQAEAAAMFALQDARHRFFSTDAAGTPLFPSAATGIRSDPYVVSNVVSSFGTETAEYWIERPYNDIGTSTYSTNSTVDLDRGNNDDIITGTNDDEDIVDDDGDDATVDPTTDVNSDGFSDVYTIIATGKVIKNNTEVAKRQIKIKATITDNFFSPISPGIHTDGGIDGSGSNPGNCFGITDGTNTVGYGSPGSWNLVPPYTIADETGLVFRSAPTLEKGTFKAMAIDQGHYHSTDLTVNNANNNYPNTSYYYTGTMPNIIYVEGSANLFKVNANRTAWGIYYVEGNVVLGGSNSTINGIVICEGNVTLNGNAFITGGIIQYGSSKKIFGNGNPSAIILDGSFFTALNQTIPIITVQSWQEAVSAN